MKKTLFVLPLVMLAACGKTENKYDAAMAGCEKIEATKQHLVYKCDANAEWVKSVKEMPANAMFKHPMETAAFADLYADTEHTYVEIPLDEDKGECSEFQMRTMVAEPNEETAWAVVGCN